MAYKQANHHQNIGEIWDHQRLEQRNRKSKVHVDGSCLNNPGPCGAGTIVFVEEETTELKQPVCKRGSILLEELIAIKIVLEYIDQPEIRTKIEQLTIFSDSQTAIGILTLQNVHWKIENHKRITHEILDKMKRIQKNGIEIKIHWIPGHANVNGNEIADRLAKEAAKEAEQNQSHKNGKTDGISVIEEDSTTSKNKKPS
jgi:ribonuclease HI